MIDTHYDGLTDWNIIPASILLSMSNVLLEPTIVTSRILKKKKRKIERKRKIEKEKTKHKRKEHFGIEHFHSPIELFNHRTVTICIANGNSFVLSTD